MLWPHYHLYCALNNSTVCHQLFLIVDKHQICFMESLNIFCTAHLIQTNYMLINDCFSLFKNPMENIMNKSFNCFSLFLSQHGLNNNCCFLALLGDVDGPRFALPMCEMADSVHEIREPTIAQLLQEKALFSFSEWPKVLSCWWPFFINWLY